MWSHGATAHPRSCCAVRYDQSLEACKRSRVLVPLLVCVCACMCMCVHVQARVASRVTCQWSLSGCCLVAAPASVRCPALHVCRRASGHLVCRLCVRGAAGHKAAVSGRGLRGAVSADTSRARPRLAAVGRGHVVRHQRCASGADILAKAATLREDSDAVG
jgi:hypothetical protein